MGNKRLVKIVDGLYARHYSSGKRALAVQFQYRAARCRETLKGLDPDNKTHVRMAIHRIGAIQEAIRLDTFDYREFFPESDRARFFGLPSARTVESIGNSWLADMKGATEYSTYRCYEGQMQRFVYGYDKEGRPSRTRPGLGKMKVSAVTPEHIRDLFRVANITLKTAQNYVIPLRALFARAHGDGDIDRDPMDRVDLKQLVPKQKHASEYEHDPLSLQEINAFLDACREHRPKWHPYWQFAFYSGLRTSEQYGLKWTDRRGEQLDVQRAVVLARDKGPKTKASKRTILLNAMASEAFKAQKQQTGLRPHVFWNANDGTPLISYKVSQTVFDYVCGKAGIRRRPQYQTRHTYASNLFLGDENPLFIARQLGHKDLQTLFRVYAKFIKGMHGDAPYTPKSDFGSNVRKAAK